MDIKRTKKHSVVSIFGYFILEGNLALHSHLLMKWDWKGLSYAPNPIEPHYYHLKVLDDDENPNEDGVMTWTSFKEKDRRFSKIEVFGNPWESPFSSNRISGKTLLLTRSRQKRDERITREELIVFGTTTF